MRVLINLLSAVVIGFNLLLSPIRASSTIHYDPLVGSILMETQPDRWLNWIAALSGEKSVVTADGEGRILTRSSFVLFDPQRKPSAFDYLKEELTQLGFVEGQDFKVHTYNFPYGDRYPEKNWKNLILTFPGSDPMLQNERVLMVAHLDSISDEELTLAPGADDNASGTAGLLEAAAVFRHYRFSRTINLIWFSGEELSRVGSEHFVADYAEWLPNIVGVINLDMFAFDWDNDRCFEIHAGVLPGSQKLGGFFEEVIDIYHLDLTFDLIDDETAYPFSDHKPFWDNSVPAVMVFENGFYQPEKTCKNADRNTTYHSISDTLTYINPDTGFSILKSALSAVAHLAVPEEYCFSKILHVYGISKSGFIFLNWEQMPTASAYQIWALEENQWVLWDTTSDTTSDTTWYSPDNGKHFQVVAISSSGCQSYPVKIDFGSLEKNPLVEKANK